MAPLTRRRKTKFPTVYFLQYTAPYVQFEYSCPLSFLFVCLCPMKTKLGYLVTVIVRWLFLTLTVSWAGLKCVIVIFNDYTLLLFIWVNK